ncbi:ABC transporter ATP-binding protein [Cryobacterium lactosi]|uniref:ABC transporter ATP-binding protein n=1 Tax=Cryobacterium lactosi TaxID=1259202 RepID=A0A4R9BXR2_9MICO|nr:dipeptide/oligopeptide/nickel ABC transporter ATP-binding protein [Cryobacterium lactosi]TFD91730.1 ABC transporter ATP-binding protein [Cryobacterium lactosi]
MRRVEADPYPIVASDLTVEYAAHGASSAFVALRGLTLTLRRGEVLGLLGESGSGKSTIARVLSGADSGPGHGEVHAQITGGEATVLGYRLRRIGRRKLARLTFGVGMLAQDAASTLPASLTVADIVAEPVLERDRHYDTAKLETLVATMIDAVRLPLSVLGSYPYELSSGQRQRVALAKALVFGPSLLIADEPTAGVDALVRDDVIDLIGELQRERAFSAVLISNDLSVLRRVADRIGVMHQGVLVGLGTIDEVFDNPWHPYVVELASALTLGTQTTQAPGGVTLPESSGAQTNLNDDRSAES